MNRPRAHLPEDTGSPDSAGSGARDLSAHTAQTGHLVRALHEGLRDAVSDFREDIAGIRDHHRADYWRLLYVFGAGFVALVAVFGWGYSRLDDRFTRADERRESMEKTLTRIETKLEDLLQRIPPVQTPVPVPRR